MKQYLINLYYRYKKGWGFFGDYKTWQAAAADCEGYDAAPILEHILTSARAVKNGEALYERDSALFYEKQELDRLTDALKYVSDSPNNSEKRLSILDFGGSLGSLYSQHRDFLSHYTDLTWCVVEQKHFVEAGKKEFETPVLKFEYTISDAVQKYKPNIALISSVLQYLENPQDWIDELVKHKIPYLWIDRTPFSLRENDWIMKQIVDKRVYEATYPLYILSLPKFKKYINQYYTIQAEFSSSDKVNERSCLFLGFFCALKNK